VPSRILLLPIHLRNISLVYIILVEIIKIIAILVQFGHKLSNLLLRAHRILICKLRVLLQSHPLNLFDLILTKVYFFPCFGLCFHEMHVVDVV